MKAEFITSAKEPKGYPETEFPEIAFAGRSNVGKSSMINTLLGTKKLVKVGKTPGKTRLVNFFLVSDRIMLVDLPGYGFAKVSKAEKAQWGETIENYFTERTQLSACVLILDIRRDPNEDDLGMLYWLQHYNVKALIALTKCDKLSNNQQISRLAKISKQLNMPREDFLIFSSLSKKGKEDVWEKIEEITS
ncbi:ribosome biogenesis GTP-binding protein YsxC [Denitrovibrio acetiphilus DSM 12809]|uniref:Probable GTP-binding protein EngB n=1 Tax=Denitrovibrio acetiphilus (strain DSM 12809 / NBRC 114555 / N2460) TaxID=522772 RepID=D4H2P0_DENA2|nr:ribosome biogenesis GTP-binding protein YihA/YsxC [Denitrovibrio acetiphilus]ADD67101.1 ribosome biogenesis GTP-binding protein YsxC [Denitrovibrio acetiphilus DSM 12809]